MNKEPYTPPGCTTMDKLEDSQIRVGIQGAPFTGKTFASLSFPSPIILSFDRKVTAHKHRTDVLNVPFYDGSFVDRIVKRDGIQCAPNRKDALIHWLETEGIKLSSSQTLVLDGSTAIEESYHIWYRENELQLATSKTGSIDGFVEWSLKKNYFGELHSCLKSIPCNVVYIVHETEATKKGESTGKLRPLLTGQAGDKLAGNFTDWFRSITISKPKDKEQIDKLKKWAGIDDATLAEWVKSTPDNHQTIYLWQTQGDELCDAGASSLVGCPKYVVASYQSFTKYKH